MARFNKTTRNIKSAPNTVNRAGGEAFTESKELALVSLILTSFLKDQYYRSGSQTEKELLELTDSVDPEFAAKAAVYARREFGMRSVSHVMAARLAKSLSGKSMAKDFYRAIVSRPDDMTEILSYYKQLNNGGKIKFPNAIKKGFADKLESLDAYQLAKYAGADKGLKLVDVVNICHPKATKPLTDLHKGNLRNVDTWEAKLSKAGQSDDVEDAKDASWKLLLSSGKLGYMAALRNVRNIISQSPESIEMLCELLVNPVAIKRSKVFPYQFIQAFNAASDVRVKVALDKAATIACSNVPKFTGLSLVALDFSGSMGTDSEKSPFGIGSAFAAALALSGKTDVIGFSDTFVRYDLSKAHSFFGLIELFKSLRKPTGTNFNLIFAAANSVKYDRIIILSDMQSWVSGGVSDSFNKYRKNVGFMTSLYSVDLQGQGTLQFPEDKVYTLAGWSNRIFDLMQLMEKNGDRKTLINEIKNYPLSCFTTKEEI